MASMLPLPTIKDLTQMSSLPLLFVKEEELPNIKNDEEMLSSQLPLDASQTDLACHTILDIDTSILPSAMQTYRDLRKFRSSIRVFPKVTQGPGVLGSGGGGEVLPEGSLIGSDSCVENRNIFSDSIGAYSTRIKISQTKVLQLGRESRRDRAALVDRFTRSILMNGGIV
jgi:hypothetical protein